MGRFPPTWTSRSNALPVALELKKSVSQTVFAVSVRLIRMLLLLGILANLPGCRKRPAEPPQSPIIQLRIEPQKIQIFTNRQVQLEALARHENGPEEIVTALCRWQTYPGQAGSISQNGLFTADSVVVGRETVQASYGQLTAEAIITVLLANAPGEMVFVPSGAFIMGSDTNGGNTGPAHPVFLKDYYIGKFEITNQQFAAFLNAVYLKGQIGVTDNFVMASNTPLLHLASPYCPIEFTEGTFQAKEGLESHPVTEVTFYGALAYARYYGCRLPTEAEWEKAARGTDERGYPWGDQAPDISLCNFSQLYGGTLPVGSFSPAGDGPYGCSDMAGNVWEWCSDWFSPDYYSVSPIQNPAGPDTGVAKVIRGGSWFSKAELVRTVYRGKNTPESSFNNLGFRVVRDVR